MLVSYTTEADIHEECGYLPGERYVEVLCGFNLLKRSSNRGDIQVRGLSPSVSWVMARLLKLDVVLERRLKQN